MSDSNQKVVLQTHNLGREFSDATRTLTVLADVNLTIHAGEKIAIVGSSGSGKTTLLQLLGGLDSPTHGDVEIRGQSVFGLKEAARGRLRNESLGFVYQFHHLLAEFSARENVAMPLLVRRLPRAQAFERAAQLLTKVGLADRLEHKPGELSGGERQRAAVARALVGEPDIVLADEPTGNLDRATGERVFDLMLALNSERQTSLVVVTHDERLAARMDRVLTLDQGRLRAT